MRKVVVSIHGLDQSKGTPLARGTLVLEVLDLIFKEIGEKVAEFSHFILGNGT